MRDPMGESSPRLKARIAGICYLLTFVTGGFAAFVSGRLAAYSDAANLIATLSYIVVTWLFYDLFKPVNRSLSLLAALFSLVGCAMGILSFFHLVPIHINAMVFFGFYCLLIGYLIFRSAFLPHILGVLMALGGLGWLTFLSPQLAHHLSPFNMAPGMLGEGALTVWLIAMGVNAQRWKQQASVGMGSMGS